MVFQSDRLRKARDQRGITQRELGELCGLPGNQISRYEQGVNDPSTEILAQLAYHLGITADYLLGLSDLPSTASIESLRQDERKLLEAYTLGDSLTILTLLAERWQKLALQHGDKIKE